MAKAITAAVDELARDRSAMSLEAANREVYLLLKERIKGSVPESDSTPHPGPPREPRSSGRESAPSKPGRDQSRLTSAATVQKGGEGNGGQKTERLRVIDWEHPANNDFLRVSQFSVTGALSATSAFILQPSSLPLVWWSSVEEARRALVG